MKSFLLILILLVPATAFADSFALATATIDWAHAGWATNGSLIVTDAVHAPPTIRGMTADGLITTSVLAQAVDGGDTIYRGDSSYVIDNLWLYGYGTGGLFITIPYSVSASCSEGSTAVASAKLRFWNGGSNSQEDIESVGCGDSKEGVLTVGLNFTNITFGPLVGISATASTSSIARVPEVPTVALLPIGLIGLGVVGKKRHAA